MRLATRIERLEQVAIPTSGGGVLVMLPGESAGEALARGTAHGDRGGVLLVHAPVTIEAWTRLAISGQAELVKRHSM